MAYSARSVWVPSALPGETRFSLLPSTGLTWGTFCWKEARLISGTRMTVPEICAGSRLSISFSIAMIDAYSVPWAPATSARTGPGLLPCTTATGMSSPASAPAGTARIPVAFWPRFAVAVPTVNGDCSAATIEAARLKNDPTANFRSTFMVASYLVGAELRSGGERHRDFLFNPSVQLKTTESGTDELLITGTFTMNRSPSAVTSQSRPVPSGSWKRGFGSAAEKPRAVSMATDITRLSNDV